MNHIKENVMKKLISILALLTILMSLVACSTSVTLPGDKTIDRVITGNIVAIDRQADYATLYFENDLSVKVTQLSLTGIAGGGVPISGVWTFYLHDLGVFSDGYHHYELVKVTRDMPENQQSK